MTPTTKLSVIVAGTFITLQLVSPLVSASAAMDATKPQGSFADYNPVPGVPALTAQNNQLNSLLQDGGMSQSNIVRFNTHGVAISGVPAALSTGSDVRAQTVQSRLAETHPNATSQNDFATVKAVRYAGSSGGYQYLEVYGSFPVFGNDLTLHCGTAFLTYDRPNASYVSETQINLKIPNNFLNRSCYIGDLYSDIDNVDHFDFTLPGLTCAEDANVCPGVSRNSFDTKTSDGQNLHIDIRDGTAPDAVFPDNVLREMGWFLTDVPADHLKNVSFIQGLGEQELAASARVESGQAANGGGVFITLLKNGNGNVDNMNALAHGVGSQFFLHLSDKDKSEFDTHQYFWGLPEDAFTLIYTDWFKNEHYSLFPMLWNASDAGSRFTSDEDRKTDLELILSMSSYFYDPKGKDLITYDPYDVTRRRQPGGTPIVFTTNLLKIGDYTLKLDGNTILSITRPDGKEARMPAGTVIPDSFLRTVPRA